MCVNIVKSMSREMGVTLKTAVSTGLLKLSYTHSPLTSLKSYEFSMSAHFLLDVTCGCVCWRVCVSRPTDKECKIGSQSSMPGL